MFHVEFFENSNGVKPFKKWLNSLANDQYVIVINRIENRLSVLGTALFATRELKPLRSGVAEFVISVHQFEARIFVHLAAGKVFWVLGAYKKSGHASKRIQDLEIEKALRALLELKIQGVYLDT